MTALDVRHALQDFVRAGGVYRVRPGEEHRVRFRGGTTVGGVARFVRGEIARLDARRASMDTYLRHKLETGDLHGVEDAASDMRDIEAARIALEDVLQFCASGAPPTTKRRTDSRPVKHRRRGRGKRSTTTGAARGRTLAAAGRSRARVAPLSTSGRTAVPTRRRSGPGGERSQRRTPAPRRRDVPRGRVQERTAGPTRTRTEATTPCSQGS